jgi:hypothetical protein
MLGSMNLSLAYVSYECIGSPGLLFAATIRKYGVSCGR